MPGSCLSASSPAIRRTCAGCTVVGPSGVLLDRALADAGIDRRRVYVTNMVKHFKWKPRGKRRIHQTPTTYEVRACRPWLDAEIARVRPELVVVLGATAAKGSVGPKVRRQPDSGARWSGRRSVRVGITIHPSAILRAPTDEARRLAYEGFVADLRRFGSR